MKYFYTFVVTCCTISFSNAQITLGASDFGSSGDTVRVTNASDLSADFVTTGANQNWNFTQLTPASQTVKRFGPMSEISGFPLFVYGPTAPTEYKASYYMDANIPLDQVSGFLPVEIEDIYQYSRKTTDSLTLLGLSMSVNGTAIPAKSDTIETKYSFPLVYGNVHHSRGFTKLNFNPLFDAEWRQHRERTTTVDGWGQLTTVYGTFDVLRVKHEIVESDSIYYNAMWIPLPIPNSTEYEWIAAGEKVPLLKITTTDFGGNEQVTAIEYRDNQFLSSENLNELEALVYPNPTVDGIQVQLKQAISHIELMDASGKIVVKDMNPTLFNHYSMEHLESGVYQLILHAENGRKAFSVVKH